MRLTKPLHRLGVVPIFELIRGSWLKNSSHSEHELPIGILTGSFVVPPAKAVPLARVCADRRGLHLSERRLRDSRYVTIDVRDANRSAIVAIITEVFSEEKSGCWLVRRLFWVRGGMPRNQFLGHGIICRFVHAVNQMRGRAIRARRGIPIKPERSGIWPA